jgi:putative polyhydroxyalkanoate system protein
LSNIDIRIAHSIPLGRARKQAERVAMQLKEQYDVEYAWSGDTLVFEHQGVTGALDVTPTEVVVHVRLGLLFGFLKPQIEKKIFHDLRQHFGPLPDAVAKPAKVKRVTATRKARSPKPPAASKVSIRHVARRT